MRRLLTFTPFFIISIGLFLYALFALGAEFFYAESEGWGILVFGIYLVISIGVMVVDVLMKTFIKSNRTLWITQLFAIIIIGLSTLLSDVKQTFILPDGFDQTYATVIFNVEGEESLPNRLMPFHKPIQINPDGYVLTSSSVPDYAFEYSQIKVIDANENELGSEASNYDFIPFQVYNFEHNGKAYKYLTLKIVPKEDCCGWSGTEVNAHHEEVQDYLKNLLK